MLVIAKWGLVFNIPVHHFSFFNFLYGLVKLSIKQATAKIKIKNGVLSTPTPQKSNLLMPSPQYLYKPVGLLNVLNTLILNMDDTGHSFTSPTPKLSTPIRHQSSRKPTAQKCALGHYFVNTALLQMSPSIPIKLLKYDKHCAIIVI